MKNTHNMRGEGWGNQIQMHMVSVIMMMIPQDYVEERKSVLHLIFPEQSSGNQYKYAILLTARNIYVDLEEK